MKANTKPDIYSEGDLSVSQGDKIKIYMTKADMVNNAPIVGRVLAMFVKEVPMENGGTYKFDTERYVVLRDDTNTLFYPEMYVRGPYKIERAE